MSTSHAWPPANSPAPTMVTLPSVSLPCPVLRGTQPQAGIFPAQQHPARLDHHLGPEDCENNRPGPEP